MNLEHRHSGAHEALDDMQRQALPDSWTRFTSNAQYGFKINARIPHLGMSHRSGASDDDGFGFFQNTERQQHADALPKSSRRPPPQH